MNINNLLSKSNAKLANFVRYLLIGIILIVGLTFTGLTIYGIVLVFNQISSQGISLRGF